MRKLNLNVRITKEKRKYYIEYLRKIVYYISSKEDVVMDFYVDD